MTRDEATALLTERGLLPTAQRIDIALLTLARPQHLSAEQIIAAIREQGLKISKATVYNTLNLFAQKGLLRPLQVNPERAQFDSNMRPHFHIHVEDTGELIDVPPHAVQFAKLPPLPPGTESVAVDVVIRVRRQGG